MSDSSRTITITFVDKRPPLVLRDYWEHAMGWSKYAVEFRDGWLELSEWTPDRFDSDPKPTLAITRYPATAITSVVVTTK